MDALLVTLIRNVENNKYRFIPVLMAALLAAFSVACSTNTLETTVATAPIEATVDATEIVEPTKEQAPTPADEEEPTPVVVDDTGFEFVVRANVDRSWATIENIKKMSALRVDGVFHDLLDGGMVSTDESGEAQLRAEGCQNLYVYQESGFLFIPDRLVVRPCSREEQGDAFCSTSSTVSFDDCKLSVETASADVTWNTTWLTVTYDEELLLTLVTVHEGEVSMQPVFEDGEPAGEVVFIESGQFAYTAPDESMAEIEQFSGLSPRTPLPLNEITPLIGALGLQDRFIQINENLISVDLEPALPIRPFIRVGGGLLNEDVVQEAILLAVDWNTLLDEVFPSTDYSVPYQGPRITRDLRDATYNPELATRFMTGMGYDSQFFVYLMYVEGDKRMDLLAKSAAKYIEEAGWPATVSAIPSKNMQEVIQDFGYGVPVMLFSWR